ncbi:MAG: hypothetical protein KatS3mg039_1412 [Candidatus Kapaibacterium sp.]|nr:MAG: hypothetical protein KatS3mg039_1412 [Candidatus Kapabacteria bacterium]
MTYDLAIAYRVYPGIAKSPAFYANNKLKLAELGLRSLQQAVGDTLRVRMFALLDGCPPEYETMVLRYFPREHTDLYRLDRIGNAGTFLLQLKLLLEQSYAEFVYFAEDDYLYRSGTFSHMVDFAASSDDVHFVTPCDHPDYFRLPLHEGCSRVRYGCGHFWRTVGSTCLTFLTRRSILRKAAPIFRTYRRGNFDASMWLALTKHGMFNPLHVARAALHSRLEAAILAKAWLFGWWHILAARRLTLWAPMPSIGTQIESDTLAPGVDWHTVAAQVERAYADS